MAKASNKNNTNEAAEAALETAVNEAAIENEADTAAAPEADSVSAAAESTEAPVDPNAFVPELFSVTTSPHIRTDETTRTIMLDVCIGLLPALIWGIYIFGWRSLTITLTAVIFAVLSEFVYQKLLKKPITVLDCSAIVTGILVAFNMPVTVPLWLPAIGSVFAIVVVKQLFGGIGKNFVNPALAARVFLFAWPTYTNTFGLPDASVSPFSITAPDVVASVTPLSSLKQGVIPEGSSLFNAIIGYEAGCIGEVSALLIAAGFVYLLFRRIITWHIPVSYIGTVFVLSLLFPQSTPTLDFALWEIFSGGLFLAAIFMATDYSTSPITSRGRIIYGIGCGALTVFIRYFGGYAEGASFSILIMNLLVWYLDRYTKPTRFGGGKVAKAK